MLTEKSFKEVSESIVNAEPNEGYIVKSGDVTFNLPSERKFGDGFAFCAPDGAKITVKAPKGFVIQLSELKTKKGGYIKSAGVNPYISLVSWQMPDEKDRKIWHVGFMQGAWDFEIDRRRGRKSKSCESIIT